MCWCFVDFHFKVTQLCFNPISNLTGMYGGVPCHGDMHSGLTAEIAVKLINHTHKHINKFLHVTREKHNFEGVVGKLTIQFNFVLLR